MSADTQVPSPTTRAVDWLLVAASLLFYAACTADLLLHPLAGGDGPTLSGDNGLVFRWLNFAAGTLSLAVGAFVLRRVPGNQVGPLLVVWSAGIAGFSLRSDWAAPVPMGAAYTIQTVFFYGLAYPALANLLLRYPTGRVFPARAVPAARVGLVLLAVAGVAANLGLYQRDGRIPVDWWGDLLARWAEPLSRVYDGLNVLALLAALLSLAGRFRQGAWRERQQIKWLMWTAAGALATVAVFIVRLGPRPVQAADPLTEGLAFVLFLYVQAVPAIAIAVAIVRHHVWDIDVILRRTLIYTVVSAVLAAVYLAGVVVLQAGLQALTGQRQGQWVTVVTTLAIAALFAPVRQRVQRLVDRRFYRQKYNAARTLEAFAHSLRDETDLERLSGKLVQVVEETMQPQGVTLWLKSG